MTKKGTKKRSKASEVDADLEIISGSRTQTRFVDTKEITGISPEFKWGELYQMIRDQKILDAGLEEMIIYQNIIRLGISKDAMHPKLFPC